MDTKKQNGTINIIQNIDVLKRKGNPIVYLIKFLKNTDIPPF